jgi:hypothetical protein
MKSFKPYYKFAGDLESRVYYQYRLIRILEDLLAITFFFTIKDLVSYEPPKSLR